jgi:hypothetical protein
MLGGAIFWVGILGWAVYSYRQKTEARERERSMRYEQFIGATLAGGGPASGTGPAGSGIAGLAANTGIDPARLAAAFMASQDAASGRTAASGRAAAAPVAAQAPVLPAPAYRLRERVLEKPQALAFYAIKAAVPDHEVFIGLSLADLLDVPDTLRGYDRDLRLKKLMPLVVDFAIVNKAMQLVAVIDLEDVKSTPEQREAQRAKAECLRPFPVRQLTFPRERLPRYQDIRQLLQSPG